MQSTDHPAAPDRAAREAELSRLLMICGHRLYHSAAQGRTQTTVLHALHENGPISQKDLQDRLGIQPGSMSELITKLENKGLLVRARDEADRRKVLLTLTVAGEAKIVRQEHKSQLPVRYTELDDGELDRLAEALQKVIKGWKEDGVPERELFAPGDRR